LGGAVRAETGCRRPLAGSIVLVAAVSLVALAAGCGSTTTVTETVTVTQTTATGATAPGPPHTWTEFGHIRTLRRDGDHDVLTFDPAWFLSGTTANLAAAEDGAVPPGEPVPNDNYRVDESHRVYTYVVPMNAKVTVITNRNGKLGPTPVSVAELARIVGGSGTTKLFEPLDTGVWVTISGDRVLSLDQQYQP
jgi:hypothetical protein